MDSLNSGNFQLLSNLEVFLYNDNLRKEMKYIKNLRENKIEVRLEWTKKNARRKEEQKVY